MRLTRLLPDPRVVDTGPDGDAAALARAMTDLYRPPVGRFVRLNLIGSVDGAATGTDGTSDTLSSRVDRALLKVIRSFADVVLVGATSVRRETFPLPDPARLAVVTSSGDLHGHRMRAASAPGRRVLVICPASAVETVRASTTELEPEIVALPLRSGRISIPDIMGALTARSLDHVLCEGGPSLAAQVIDSGLADELCLTTSPVLGGGGGPSTDGREGRAVHLLDTLAGRHPAVLRQLLADDDGYLFARWSLSERGREVLSPTR